MTITFVSCSQIILQKSSAVSFNGPCVAMYCLSYLQKTNERQENTDENQVFLHAIDIVRIDVIGSWLVGGIEHDARAIERQHVAVAVFGAIDVFERLLKIPKKVVVGTLVQNQILFFVARVASVSSFCQICHVLFKFRT